MVSQIYASKLQLNNAYNTDTKAAFLDLHLSISNHIVSTKIFDKRDLNLYRAKVFRNLSSMVTWCINCRRLLALIIFQHSLLK